MTGFAANYDQTSHVVWRNDKHGWLGPGPFCACGTHKRCYSSPSLLWSVGYRLFLVPSLSRYILSPPKPNRSIHLRML